MQLQNGRIVCAAAGKEKNQFYLIIRQDENFVYLADGRHRTLEKPKRKNPKHVRPTKTLLSLQDMTNKSLRRFLHEYQEENRFV